MPNTPSPTPTSIPSPTGPHHPTTSSTSTVVVPQPTTDPSKYLQWDSIVFVLVGLFVFGMVVKSILELFKLIVDFLDRKKKLNEEQDEPLRARVKVLEETTKSFLTKEEIEKGFSDFNARLIHEKDNRRMIQDNFDERLRLVQENQTEDRLARTRLESKVETLTTNGKRVEDAVEALRERVDERFDRLHDAILNKPKSN